MSESKKHAGWPVVAALAAPIVIAGAVGLYAWGYFATSQCHDTPNGYATWRVFDREWEESIFYPALRVESWLRGVKIDSSTKVQGGVI